MCKETTETSWDDPQLYVLQEKNISSFVRSQTTHEEIGVDTNQPWRYSLNRTSLHRRTPLGPHRKVGLRQVSGVPQNHGRVPNHTIRGWRLCRMRACPLLGIAANALEYSEVPHIAKFIFNLLCMNVLQKDK
jgi:hypothetical protein